MPWQREGEVQSLPSSALVANILCARHNNALSPLDALAGKSFDALISSADYAVHQQHAGKVLYSLTSGHALELWMYKLAAGIYFGKIAVANGKRVRDTCDFPENEIAHHLTEGTLSPEGGLYVTQNVGEVPRSNIAIAPLTEASSNCCVGVQVQFGPLQFATTVVRPKVPTTAEAAVRGRRRPHVIDFLGPARDARVLLTWPRTKGEFQRLGVQFAAP